MTRCNRLRIHNNQPDFCIRDYGHCENHEFTNGDIIEQQEKSVKQ